MSTLVELNAKLPQKLDAQSEAREAEIIAKKIANGEYSGTFIDGKKIYSPEIYGNKISVITDSGNDNGFHIYGKYGGKLYDFFAITYFEGTAPEITLDSPEAGKVNIGGYNKRTTFYGTVDFSSATVEWLNINATFS